MPPVRWKVEFYVTAIFVQVALAAAAQQIQDSISMSSDGWRPIVGTRRQPVESDLSPFSSTHRVYDVDTTMPPLNQKASKSPYKTIGYNGKQQAPKTKQGISYFLPSGSAQISSSGSPQQVKKLQAIKKPVVLQSKPKKVVKGQMMSHSTRNEVFLPPPPSNNGGTYSFIKPIPQNSIRTREAQGFALANSNFGITQQGAHLELSRFPLPADNILQRPTFFVAKPLQNEDFHRNLVPPPPRTRNQQKSKVDTISLYAFKEGPATDATSNVPQFGGRPNQYLSQVSSAFDHSSQPQKTGPKVKEQTVDVQVTKESLKQYSQGVAPAAFGTVPGRNNFPIGYVDYDFQKPRPSNAPSTLTYEVTEGKWLDTPSHQYQFRPQDAFFQYQNIRQPGLPNARPGLLFQSVSSSGPPPIFQAPIVDLNVSPFLPTPYKPESVILPTSPTQNEAATVFNKVSNKVNKLRNNALKENPFEIKDVSTHYPILGKPEYQSESGTDMPLPINDNGEISNEITTTQNEREKERPRRPLAVPATPPTSTRDPTRARISNRRRPRPKKPMTTTEEPVVVESYESMKSQENLEETPVEIEKPQRRRRPRPPSFVQMSQQEGDSSKQSEEDAYSKQRGRYRFRSRERTTERIDTNIVQRKRPRPSYEKFEEPTESSMEPENYPVFLPESSQSEESVQTEMIPQEPVQPDHNKPFIEENLTTQRVRVTSTTEPETITHFHAPENEVDYTTQTQIIVREDLTSQPLTTTEVPSSSSVKSTRIRRPTKYDSSNRPRFSVKEYRQRLNQHSSTTPATTTISTKTVNDNSNPRLRFPSRLRTRPTTASSRIDEDVTDEVPPLSTSMRTRFRPKEPKYDQSTTTEAVDVITEKIIKAVNTRLRPFGRTKNTPETTTLTNKISIRPNLFSARRRAGYPSLKNRLQDKLRKNGTTNSDEEDEDTAGEIDPLNVAESGTTEQLSTTTTELPHINEESTEFIIEESMTEDVMRSEDYEVSQRVSDLTSSFQGYDKPGAFNAVAPTSRSIPNHFTLSTDDPILPIEAFFPSLKEKSKER
ncbi:enolase-phosphatase E1-like [Euwallacea similis]|uniref:enolase-phosphatase E1-like n=1 Tax=Euwallacea similis TaxID=1736056 RepID=UPI00344F179F